MKPYQHLSGAQKRKKKKELEKQGNKNMKLDLFFSSNNNNNNSMNDNNDKNGNRDSDCSEVRESTNNDKSENRDLVATSSKTIFVNSNESDCVNGDLVASSSRTDFVNSEESDCVDRDLVASSSKTIIVNSNESDCVNRDCVASSSKTIFVNSEESDCVKINRDLVASSSKTVFVDSNKSDCDRPDDNCVFNVNNDFPTDREHFPQIVEDRIKNLIVSHGPCQPKGPFPCDPQQENRHFSTSYYEKQTRTGMSLRRDWLCYSQKGDYVYCHSCWLFADRSSPFYHNSWVNGVRDWKGLTKKIKDHERSTSHIDASVNLNVWMKRSTIDAYFESKIERETTKWHKILHRIVNVTLTLATGNLAFRGHREEIGEINSGNFLSIIELLSKYDPVLEELLKKDKNTQKYLSPAIQNELIEVLAKKVKSEIIREINDSMFYSLILDTTVDITKKDQLSQVFRYVTICKDSSGKPTELVINESFLGFKVIEDQTASGLVDSILESLSEFGLPLSKCRGQGYDGAATMSGVYSGVQTRILSKQKTAKYVHCAAHNLNLVMNDAISGIPENVNFFGILEQLYVFFSQSSKRWDLLSSCSQSLKRLCPTRWSSRVDSLKALRYCFAEVMKALSKIILLSSKPREKNEAIGLKKHLESFSFVFLVVMHSKILEALNVASKHLQNKDYDLYKATVQLERAKENLSNARNDFEGLKKAAIDLSRNWGVNQEFDDKRVRKVRKHFDELSQDERLVDREKLFKTTVFYTTLDTVIAQLTTRFQAMSRVTSLFIVLTPKFLTQASDEEVSKKVDILASEYEEDLSNDLTFQLNSFRRALKTELAEATSIRQLAELLMIENHSIASSFPDICMACILFLTLPVTVASAERSFSKLKMIKNYLRSTMTQDRLCSLALLSIENQRARKLELDEVIRLFASQKARRQSKLSK